MHTLAYIRVSDPRQASEDKTSLDAQRAAIEALAGRLGRAIAADGWYTEPGFSGGTADRPAFQRMLAYCQSNPRRSKDGQVLVYSDSRWGRFEDPEEAAHWRFVFRELGWLVRFATNDEAGDATARTIMRAVGAATASHERETIRQRARMGGRGAAARGLWTNHAPFGYRRLATEPVTGGQRVLGAGQRKAPGERLTLTPGPDDEVAFVRWLFTSYASGRYTLAALTREAPTRYPKRWIRRSLHQMLLVPTYAGDTVIGRRASDLAAPQVTRDTHPALVDRETIAAVHRILARNRKETSPTRGGYPLSGLVTCATCGSAFVGGGGRRGDVDPDEYRFYRDSGAVKQPPFPGHLMTFRRRDVEPLVIDAIADVLETSPIEALLREAVEAVLRTSEGDQADQRAALEKTRDTERRKLDRLVTAIGEGTIRAEDAKGQADAIRRRLEDAELALGRLRFDRRRVERLESEGERLVEMARDFRTTARRLSGVDLRELLRPWIHSAVVDKHTRRLVLDIRPIPADVSLFTPGLRERGKPCSPGDSPPFCRP